MQLHQFFNQNPRIAVAYSGGVDSSYLIYAAKAAGCDVHAYFIKSQFQPEFELADAKRLTDSLRVPLIVGTLDVLCDANIYRNQHDRCYYCKTAILTEVFKLAQADGITLLCDGTNADDDENDRPGMQALQEQKVISPLRDCGLAKDDIRHKSKQAGLFTHNKPSYACLATRIPTGMTITSSLLEKIEAAENALFDMGFTNFRVRVMEQGTKPQMEDLSETQKNAFSAAYEKQRNGSSGFHVIARIQMPETQWSAAAARRNDILTALKPGFSSVVLDLVPR